jgi:hypothetical protein
VGLHTAVLLGHVENGLKHGLPNSKNSFAFVLHDLIAMKNRSITTTIASSDFN